MKELRLQILISTFGADGLRRVSEMNLPRLDGVGYIVSCQDPGRTISEPYSILAVRDDVKLFIHSDRGLGLNRSHAMASATAEFVLVADDDLRYDASALCQALAIMESHPGVDIFAFRYSGADNKLYPPDEHDLSESFKGYNLTSFELGYRLSAVRGRGVDFSPLLGVGAPYLTASEENIFTERCLQQGLRGRFFPLTIVEHPGPTTGYRLASNPGTVRSTAAFIYVKYGLAEGLARCLLLAGRVPLPYHKALLYAFQGMAYAVKHRKEL